MGSQVDRHKRLGIPRRFRLHGHQIVVRIIPASKWPHAKSTVGMWDPTAQRIDLCNALGDTQLQAIFCHELVHCLLDSFNHKMSHDEVFVDNLGSVLAQALATFDSNPKVTCAKDSQ